MTPKPPKKRLTATERRLARVKKLVADGHEVIGNEAALRGTDDVVVHGVRGGLVFQWSRVNKGFGELTVVVRDGQLLVDAEGESLSFCADVITQALAETEAFKLPPPPPPLPPPDAEDE